MPTNPASPNSSAAVDRLALGIDSPRGTEPATHSGVWLVGHGQCFEAEASGLSLCLSCGSCVCFEA